MGADSSAENTPNAPEFICPISSQPQSSGFQWKKASLGVRSPWSEQLKKYFSRDENYKEKLSWQLDKFKEKSEQL